MRCVGNIELGQNFHASDEGHIAVRFKGFPIMQYAVHPEADARDFFTGFQMNIACAPEHTLFNNGIQFFGHRKIIGLEANHLFLGKPDDFNRFIRRGLADGGNGFFDFDVILRYG